MITTASASVAASSSSPFKRRNSYQRRYIRSACCHRRRDGSARCRSHRSRQARRCPAPHSSARFSGRASALSSRPASRMPMAPPCSGELLVMDGEDEFAAKPDGHFASSRSTCRHFFISRRATSICAANSGSATVSRNPSWSLDRVQRVALLHAELHQHLLGENHPDGISDARQLQGTDMIHLQRPVITRVGTRSYKMKRLRSPFCASGADPLVHIGGVHRDRLARPVGGGEADLLEQPLQHRVQPAGADILDPVVDIGRQVGHRVHGVVAEVQRHPLRPQQRRVLLDQRVLRLGQDAAEIVAGQRPQLHPDRQSALQLGQQIGRAWPGGRRRRR